MGQQTPWKNASWWLSHSLMLTCLSNVAHDNLPRDGPSKVGRILLQQLTMKINPTDVFTDESDLGDSSTNTSLSGDSTLPQVHN